MNKKIFQITTISVFAILLLLPTFQAITNLIPKPHVGNENRRLKKMPKFNKKNIDAFQPQFEDFVNDNFPLRTQYLAPAFTIMTAFDISPVKNTIIGKNDFLYRREEAERYTGEILVPDSLLTKWVKVVKERNQKLQKMGIKFYVAIIPSSLEIYPEYLPRYIERVPETPLDKLCALMNKDAQEVKFINFKNLLLQNKDKGLLYYKYDIHWNHIGAYYASRCLMDSIKKDFPEIQLLQKDDFIFNEEKAVSGGLINPILTKQNKKFFEPESDYSISYRDSSNNLIKGEPRNYPLPKAIKHKRGFDYELVYKTDKSTYPKAFVIRDSFWRLMNDFISPHFRETVCIWDAWTYWDNLELIEKEKPDLVIMEVYERYFDNLAKFNEVPQN